DGAAQGLPADCHHTRRPPVYRPDVRGVDQPGLGGPGRQDAGVVLARRGTVDLDQCGDFPRGVAGDHAPRLTAGGGRDALFMGCAACPFPGAPTQKQNPGKGVPEETTMKQHVKLGMSALAFAAAIACGHAWAGEAEAKKWVDNEFQPSSLAKDKQ